MKDVDRRIEAIAQVNVESKEEKVERAEFKDMDRRIEAIAQVNVESKEGKVERAEFNVPTCGHIAVCQRCRDKFRAFSRPHPLFSTFKVRLIEIGICILLRHQCFSVVAQATPQDLQRQPNGSFRMKDVDRRIEVIAQVNVESKNEKVERAEFNVPTCGHIAVCQRCRDRDKFRAFSRPHPCFLR